MKDFVAGFIKLIKLRLTLLVVFSASVSFLIGNKQQGASIDWMSWAMLTIGGFLVTSAANSFNEIIEKDLDKLMQRTMDRPLPSGKMTTGQALVLGLFMALAGTLILIRLNFLTGILSVFSIFLYAFLYTPLKRKSPIAVFVGAFPGALPPLIGYFAAFNQHDIRITWVPIVLFLIQFVWQFPHFWGIAWVLDDDYKKAGFRLLPTTMRDRTSAIFVFASTLLLIPVSLLPTIMGFGGYTIGAVSLAADLMFCWYAWRLVTNLDIASAKKVMFGSFAYLPLVQLVLLFNYIIR